MAVSRGSPLTTIRARSAIKVETAHLALPTHVSVALGLDLDAQIMTRRDLRDHVAALMPVSVKQGVVTVVVGAAGCTWCRSLAVVGRVVLTDNRRALHLRSRSAQVTVKRAEQQRRYASLLISRLPGGYGRA